ncbi:MAG: hypothetical protein AAF405_02365, partial [Pseudomonadota bacterium]
MRFIQFLQNSDETSHSRAILHYDLNHAVRTGFDNYADEPAAQAILLFETATIVKIMPTPARLWAQYAHRVFGGQTLKETTLNVVHLTNTAWSTRHARMFL